VSLPLLFLLEFVAASAEILVQYIQEPLCTASQLLYHALVEPLDPKTTVNVNASDHTIQVASMSSDEDATQLMAAFKKGGTARTGPSKSKSKSASAAPPSRSATPRRSPSRTPPPKKQKRVSIAVENFLSESSSGEDLDNAESPSKVRRVLQIRPSPVRNRKEYTYFEPQDEVESIVREVTIKGRVMYEVTLEGGATKEVGETATPSDWGKE
jgi:hypothetical protein